MSLMKMRKRYYRDAFGMEEESKRDPTWSSFTWRAFLALLLFAGGIFSVLRGRTGVMMLMAGTVFSVMAMKQYKTLNTKVVVSKRKPEPKSKTRTSNANKRKRKKR
jgi:hypothetical protein